jgi:hypothetical protein
MSASSPKSDTYSPKIARREGRDYAAVFGSGNQETVGMTAITTRGPARRKTEGDGKEMFQAVCKLGLEGIVSTGCTLSLQSVESVDKSQNAKAPAATRAVDGTF